MNKVFSAIAFVWIAVIFLNNQGRAQNAIENLIVETYYVSDANDATDEDGGTLPEGSVTYRVYLDPQEGVRITQIFGNENHPWEISSTENFWNNIDRGEAYGYDIGDNRLDENTVALDSWITFGAASDEHFGIPKANDTDGSIVGGENNDGGSAGIEGGLLVNFTPEMGQPLTESDGLVPWPQAEELPQFFVTGVDELETLLGDEVTGSSFLSNESSFLQFSQGISGPTDDNIVLIAQFTTQGELSFKFNVQLLVPGIDDPVNYVADGGNLQEGEVISPFLTFPPECGCTDPDYLEFDPAAPCDDGSCETLIAFGCADPNACNFDPSANFNIPELCCFSVDSCNGLDWTVICPTLNLEEDLKNVEFEAFPNPTRDFMTLNIDVLEPQEASIRVFDLSGKCIVQERRYLYPGDNKHRLNLAELEGGTYLIRLLTESFERSLLIIKN